MAKRCIRYRNTADGRRCAEYGDRDNNQEHATIEIPALSGWGVTNKSVNSTDVLMGAGLGIAGAFGAKWALKKFDLLPAPAAVPMTDSGTSATAGFAAFDSKNIVGMLIPAAGAVAAGTLAFAAQRKKNKGRALGHLVGAVAGGLIVTAWDFLKSQYPALAGVVAVDLRGYGSSYGLLVDDRAPRRLEGVLVDDKVHMAGIAELAMADGEGDYDDFGLGD